MANGKERKHLQLQFLPNHFTVPTISSNRWHHFFEEFHDGGEVGAGKHLLDLLVMRGDLGVFIMASWTHFFLTGWKQIPGAKTPEVNQHPLASLIYIHYH